MQCPACGCWVLEQVECPECARRELEDRELDADFDEGLNAEGADELELEDELE